MQVTLFRQMLEHSCQSTGRAIIQLDNRTKDNAIVLFPGANASEPSAFPEDLSHYSLLALQNEVPLQHTREALTLAKGQGISCLLNPSPSISHHRFPYELVDWLCVNEDELFELYQAVIADTEVSLKKAQQGLVKKFPNLNLVVTLGARGCQALSKSWEVSCPTGKLPGPVVDTVSPLVAH